MRSRKFYPDSKEEESDLNLSVSYKITDGIIFVTFDFSGFIVSTVEHLFNGKRVTFDLLKIPRTGYLSVEGWPLMPSLGKYLVIPLDMSLGNIEVTTDGHLTVPIQNKVIPAQNKWGYGPDGQYDLNFDTEIYSKDELYPLQIVPDKPRGPYFINERKTFLINVRPIQYNPGENSLVFHKKIIVSLSTTRAFFIDDEEKRDALNYQPELGSERFGDLLINPQYSPGGKGDSNFQDFSHKWDFGECIDDRKYGFLIICSQKYKDAANELKKWKNQKGILTKVKIVGEMPDKKAVIKKTIRNQRRTLGSQLRFVLLLGDETEIPPDYVPAFGESGEITSAKPTDYYYSTREDPDPQRPDAILKPWLSVGRIPAKSEGEAMDIVRKIINYEKRPPQGDSKYFSEMTLAAYFQDNNDGCFYRNGEEDLCYVKTMEDIFSCMKNHKHIKRIYVPSFEDDPDNPDPPAQYRDNTQVTNDVKAILEKYNNHARATSDLIDAARKGQNVIAHRDHGWMRGWVYPPFQKNNLVGASGKLSSVFFNVECSTGRFDGQEDSFSENLLKMNGGAPSCIAPTALTNPFLNDALLKGLFHALWGGILEDPDPLNNVPGVSSVKRLNKMGEILEFARCNVMAKRDFIDREAGSNEDGSDVAISNDCVRDHLESYHVLGDPTLEVWTEPPEDNIFITAWIDNNRPHRLNFRMSGQASWPPGSIITIWKEKNEEAWKFRPERLEFHWEAWSKDEESTISFWAPAWRYKEISVAVK